MTKELELPELPEPAWPSPVARQPYYTADQMRAYALATLAKTQEGGMEFRACVCHNDSDKRLCLHKADCSVVEAQSSLTAKQKAPEGDGIVLCRECGKPTMHMGTLCFHCSKSDSAAPDGGDVEQRAREMLAAEWRACGRDDVAIGLSNPALLTRENPAINAIIAALRQPAQVSAEPARYFADGPQGHFFADDLKLARELVNIYDKQDDWTITDLQNPTGQSSPQAAPVPVEGESVAAVVTDSGMAFQYGQLLRDLPDGTKLYTHPPEQPAVELEQFRALANRRIAEADKYDKAEHGSAAYVMGWSDCAHGFANQLLALIDGAKAGEGEGHE